ncbi:response regulator [Trinickia fusca]|uniref:DNA-binding response regulator n=1 Tax=Trinickia fusca TaxID=2419777 RepID=A0A494XGE4_9BURK|nr:response regulator transcription factor [Trinickia fusca]RKP47626.1 DNA-binding response regulator [Trinickia fusca]
MKLLVVDDHPALRAGLAALLSQVEVGTVVLEAGDGAEALRIAESHADLAAVFVDLYMPGMDGMLVMQAFAEQYSHMPLVVVSSSEEPQDVRHALAVGASGYIPKSASPQTILSALRLVLSGDVYVPPLMLQARPVETGSAHLTERQLEVLHWVCEGLSNKEIGRKLNLAEKTVKVHITMIFKLLNVVNRTQAANAARQMGLAAPNQAARR